MVVRMDITPYVESLRHDLSAVAEAAGPEAREAAQRLMLALDPAVRLALVEALSQAAAEITSELPAGSVDVRMHGREPTFVVDVPSMPVPPPPPAPPAPQPVAAEDDDDGDDEDGVVARITLRIPESLKTRAEDLAAKSGASLNSWIVNAVRAATRRGRLDFDVDLSTAIQNAIQSSLPGSFPAGGPGGRNRPGRRMTGWV